MTYVLHIRVDDVSFGDKAGAARSKFYAEDDTLRVEVDLTRLSNPTRDFAFVVGHEIAHHLAGVSPHIDNGPELPLPDEETPTSTPEQLKAFHVTFRRTATQFASTVIEAADAEAAVRLGRTLMVQPGNELTWEGENTDEPDWVQAELGMEYPTVEGEADHAEWEEPKPSPAVPVKALNEIAAIAEDSSHEPGSALIEIRTIALRALGEMVPTDE